jgi:predicted RecB family endonuclease
MKPVTEKRVTEEMWRALATKLGVLDLDAALTMWPDTCVLALGVDDYHAIIKALRDARRRRRA